MRLRPGRNRHSLVTAHPADRLFPAARSMIASPNPQEGEAHETDGSGRASWALAAERLRPYTEQEAMAFLQLHHALRRALPRHRAELDDIAALARPLMPPRMQSARIDRPHPPVWGWPMWMLCR
ncbi:hypothetical protein ACFXKC_54280 [Streptomyces sp. NPDC059340]|uniref:hypothetical protein n=1 Tax=Streptomyces sp. NPDC059340 TaxID=3346806 RepID=UPI0036883AB5